MQQNGVLVINKPKGITSAHVVSQIKRLGQKKIGHAGTLDPMATGVLLILLGQATKLSNYLLEGGKKIYEGELIFGKITDTWDIEGIIIEENDPSQISLENVEKEISKWLGKTSQIVPPYSAAKHKGQALYKLAREGKEVPVKIKEIEISQAQILSSDLPNLRFRVECSSGSYIRSLAHSLGKRLGCGACLTSLTRLYSHPFNIEQACNLEEIKENPDLLCQNLHSIAEALNWSLITCNEELADEIRNGKSVSQDFLALNSNFQQIQELKDNTDFNARALLQEEDGSELALMQAGYQEGHASPVWNVLRGLWGSL